MFRLLGFEYLQRDDLVQVKPSLDADKEDFVMLGENSHTPEPQRMTERTPDPVAETASNEASGNQFSNADSYMKTLQSDAPSCNVCGHITVRSGTCYKCLNCGNSLGCS